jgi:putative transposase
VSAEHGSAQMRAQECGVSRASLYYHKKQPNKDWIFKVKIEEVLRAHPAYGYRRVAIHLKENKKKVQRAMRLYGIKAYRRRAKRWKKPRKQAEKYENLLMTHAPQYPHQVWVADFTHVRWQDKDVRVATTVDVYTRQVVGIAIGTRGGTALIMSSFGNALLQHPRPTLFHSDNGREYDAKAFKAVLMELGIAISRSKPGCPWENGYQESFYSQFKVELGDPNRFKTLGELVAAIYQTVHQYNTARIHSALRMPPRQFAHQCVLHLP